jgi:hypothetical protein
MDDRTPLNFEPLLATLANVLLAEGASQEAAILSMSDQPVVSHEFDRWNGGTFIYKVVVPVPALLFGKISTQRQELTQKIFQRLEEILQPFENHILKQLIISPIPIADKDWRQQLIKEISGGAITNQGRVRSDNIGAIPCDGLLFRSKAEINFYQAIRSTGLSFAPLPVFIKGGKEYRRIEPDFVIIREGMMIIIEVDGDTYHVETPAEAYGRTTMLEHEGARVIRVMASECKTLESAKTVVAKVLEDIRRLKASK